MQNNYLFAHFSLLFENFRLIFENNILKTAVRLLQNLCENIMRKKYFISIIFQFASTSFYVKI